MAFPSLGPAIAASIEHRSSKVADTVSKSNAILFQLQKKGGMKSYSGGTEIRETLTLDQNTNAQWYSGYDTLNRAAADVLDVARFSPKQAAVAVTLSGKDLMENSGKEAIIDRLETELDVAEKTIKNLFTQGIYSDGTGSSGKQLTGLKAAVPIAPATGTYGGIDRATWTFWRNQKLKGAGTDFAGAVTSANIVELYTEMLLKTTRGSDRVNLIMAGHNHYKALIAALQGQQRFTNAELANVGFQTLQFQGVDVVYEPVNAGLDATLSYFLNLDALKVRYHAERNFRALDANGRKPIDQDAETHYMVWMGNLTASDAARNGVISD